MRRGLGALPTLTAGVIKTVATSAFATPAVNPTSAPSSSTPFYKSPVFIGVVAIGLAGGAYYLYKRRR
jgi:hypothetical protein